MPQSQQQPEERGARSPNNFWNPEVRSQHRTERNREWRDRPRRWDLQLRSDQAGRFRYALLLLLGVLTWMLLSSCASSSEWNPARRQLDGSQVEAIATENSSLKPGTSEYEQLTEAMLVRELAAGLIAIDFNSPLLTGANGVRFAIYLEDTSTGAPTAVLQTYVSGLPPEYERVRVLDRSLNGLPCLHILQAASAGEIEQFEMCFDGDRYTLRDRKTLPINSGGTTNAD